MKIFISTFFICLSVVGFINYKIDPMGRWHHDDRRLQSLWASDQCLESSDGNEFELKLAMSKIIPDTDVIVFGSSRSAPINTKMFIGRRVFNASVRGIKLNELAVLGKTVIDRVHSKLNLFFVDPWIFNAWVTEHNPSALAAPTGKRMPETATALKMQKLFGSAYDTYADWSDLFVYGNLSASYEKILLRRNNEEYGHRWPINDEAMLRVECFRNDGSIRPVSVPDNPHAFDFDVVHQRAIDYFVGGLFNFENWEFDPHTIDVLLGFKKTAFEKYGAQTQFIMLPYNPVTYALMLKDKATRDILTQVQAAVAPLSDSGLLCNHIDPASVGCDETEFRDGMHLKDSCLLKVLQSCGFKTPSSLR